MQKLLQYKNKKVRDSELEEGRKLGTIHIGKQKIPPPCR
jgi:hypothetical protein